MIRINDKVEYSTTRVAFTETILHKNDLDIDVLIGEFDSYHCVDCGEAKLWDHYDIEHGTINIIQRILKKKKETDLQGNVNDIEYYSYIFEKEIDLGSYEAEYSFNGRNESQRQLMMNCYGKRINNMVVFWLKSVLPEGKIVDYVIKGHNAIIHLADKPTVYLDTYPFMRLTIIEYLKHRILNNG